MPSTAMGQRTSRRAFVARLLAATPEALVIAGLGSAAYDVFAAGDRERNFYLWGAMGGATSIGLGLALAQPQQSVVVITGDGEQLMGIGSLGTDLVAVAKGFGIEDAFSTGSLAASDDIARRISARSGTLFVQVLIEADEPPRALPPRDGAYVKNRFRAALGLKPF